MLAELMWPAAKVTFVSSPELPPGILGFANPAAGGRIVVAHRAHGKLMLETAGHEAAHFVLPHLSAAQRAILLRELPRGMPMPNADEDLAERIGCWCAAKYRRERLPALSPQAARIMRNILYGDYWFRQKEKPEQAILAIALMPVVAMAGLLIMLFVVLISHL
ncbi:MAG: hypothetical protein ACM3Q0_05330 [Bacteroidota bacterium]